ncbi:hypothetical protein LCGC14_1309680 [marine sediment metagenome]|uniref:Uncharacterized protein n=1 Tax=marine sediment metagenome TaxID=412755 RepID=A0A0F9NQ74_9ZZZZ
MDEHEIHVEAPNGFWRRVCMGLIITLILGAYGYAYSVDSRTVKRDEFKYVQGQLTSIQSDVKSINKYLMERRLP